MKLNTTETANFRIFYDEADTEMLETVKVKIQTAYTKVRQDFSITQNAGKFDFFLCPDVDSFIEYTGKSKENYQDWMVGNADYKRKRLCILSPRAVRDRSCEEMMKVIVHEIVHIAMDSLADADEVELWIAEGIALLYAGQTEPEYISETDFPKLNSLIGEEDFADNGGYDYAGVYVWYFIEKFGADIFKRVYMGLEQSGKYLYPEFEEEAVKEFRKRGNEKEVKMDIKAQFNLIAEEYDVNRKKFIPCFNDYYENTTRLIASNIAEPGRILDLGAGTGLLSYFWYRQFPSSEFVLVDIADEMLNIAGKRFKGIDNVHCQVLDYSKELPAGAFDVIVSALSIHHLDDDEKAKLFARIYGKLPTGGLFVNYDQFCAGCPEMNDWYDSYWESQLSDSGLTDSDIALWKERRKLDKECSVEAETEMLRECKFKTVKCVYSYHKFSVVVAVK